MNRLKPFTKLLLLTALFVPLACSRASGEVVRAGNYVELKYSLKADETEVVPATKQETMKLVVGQNQYPPNFEKALIGLKTGQTKVIALEPGEAYGPRRPELLKRVAREALPPQLAKPSVGQVFQAADNAGKPIVLRVAQVLDDSVILDSNHPLAGRKLTYEVEILSVNG